jgi:energy-coupling factor transport system ATP-binding protein
MTTAFREQPVQAQKRDEHKSGEVVIAIENLNVTYGDKAALNSVSSQINQGEIVAVMGRNGAGKSSLLKAIAGVNPVQSGKIRVLGNNPVDLQGKLRRQSIGFIPQEPSDLLYGQSVQIECDQADRDNELAAGTTYLVLEQLVPGISATTHPRDLSEGQRLGLALSVVVSSNPGVLILDEPTRGLDYEAKSQLTRILIQFAATFGKAVILATHDVELVAELATRVIFVADGDIVADGSTLDVLLSSPAFAPQVAKVMSPQPWLSVKDVVAAIKEIP